MNRGVFSGGNGNSWRPPLFKLGNFPIHVTGLIVLLQILGMLAYVITGGALAEWVVFSPNLVLSGRIWTIVSYAFFEAPSINFVIGCYFFARFGSSVEHSIGRRNFVILCLILLFIGPAILMGAHFVGLGSSSLYGSWIPHTSVFMAFCAMNPNVPSFFGIRIKWFGLAFFVVAVLQFLAMRDWPLFCAYVSAVGFSIWYIRKLGYREGFSISEELLGPGRRLPRLSGVGKKKKARRAREIKSKLRPKSALLKQDDSEVDRILDKINNEGLHSLTDEERALLQKKARK
jgi:hypothetical protein